MADTETIFLMNRNYTRDKFRKRFNLNHPNKWWEFQEYGNKIQKVIGYTFNDVVNLWDAMFLRGGKIRNRRIFNQFERLEFLGDSIVGGICSSLLHQRMRESSVGLATFLRQALVSNRALSLQADKIFFREISLLLAHSGANQKKAADYVEAIIGAIFVDNEYRIEGIIELVKEIIDFDRGFEEILQNPWSVHLPNRLRNELYGLPSEIVKNKNHIFITFLNRLSKTYQE